MQEGKECELDLGAGGVFYSLIGQTRTCRSRCGVHLCVAAQ